MHRLLASVLFTLSLAPQLEARQLETERVEIPGELVVCFHTDGVAFDLEATVARWGLDASDSPASVEGVRSLLQWQRRGETLITNVVLVQYTPVTADSLDLRQRIVAAEGVSWAAPNVGLTGEVRELIPNDPQYGSQYHHPLMQNDDAWDTTLGDPNVILGITDDGVDLDHVDLISNIWVNAGEIPGDGIDNDGNGYVDDVNGWDFVWVNNDPNPNGSDDHGTHVAGIAAGDTNNGIGIAGVAGAATIMPLQFYSSGQPWTAAVIAETFAYGVDNGARILSTSYNMDGWVGDPIVTAAYDYLYDNDALHFNSAGNGSAMNPPRQAFHQTMLVASTDSGDVKSSFSNYGTGVDLAAPGSSILSTIVNDAYGTKSGTSMAAPNAAGVAGLIWSAHPTWTRDQVAAQIYFTADNIDAQNPGLVGLLGGGRVNSYHAVTDTLPAPRLTLAEGLPSEGGNLVGALSGFELRFDQILDPNAVNAAGAFALVFAGADGSFGTGDDQNVAITWDEYLVGSNRVFFSPPGSLPGSGFYRFIADASVLTNPFGTALDGDGDGTPGDSWVRNFSACTTIVLLEDNAESGVDWSVVNENLSTGAWTPNPEVPIGGGIRRDPPTDYDGSGKCFLTENAPGDTDVDGGPTRLISRAFDLTVTPDPYLSFARWLETSGDDVMIVDVSEDNGAHWTNVTTLPGDTGWKVETFRVADHVVPSAQTRLRFSVEDNASAPSVTEAGIDYLRILAIDCGQPGVGTSYCVSTPNSTGFPGTIRAVGSDDISQNDFTLIAESLPPGQFGVFFFGPTQMQLPFGNGFRCVGGGVVRLSPTILTSAGGVAQRVLDLTAPPVAGSIAPGVTTNFQFWHRDPPAGGATFDLTDGLSVTWQ